MRAAESEFAAWYEREAKGVSGTLALVLADRSLAEEATAEAFARAWAEWHRVRVMASPVGWVYQVGLNHARGGFRRRRLERRALRTRQEVVAPPDEPNDALWAAVALLAPRARMAIGLRYVADLSETQVAELMGIARGTVAATLHSARRQLADRLAPDNEEVAP